MKATLLTLVLLGVAGGGWVYYAQRPTADTVTQYRTVAIKRGDLLSTIGATGTVEPEEVVDVGAQVMGSILEFGPDPQSPTKLIDYGSVVEEGHRVWRTSTPLPMRRPSIRRRRRWNDRRRICCSWRRNTNRRSRSGSAQSSASAEGDRRHRIRHRPGQLQSGQGNVAVGKATIRQNEASLRVAKTNLGYTTIKSPVQGVIIDRRVNIGQTVVASLNAPSLFLIAKDLRRMQVWASVNEADIGRIRLDMPVRFTVDAYPGEMFRGKVTQIRLNATMTQNVVTYTVVVTTDNSERQVAAVPDGERPI